MSIIGKGDLLSKLFLMIVGYPVLHQNLHQNAPIIRNGAFATTFYLEMLVKDTIFDIFSILVSLTAIYLISQRFKKFLFRLIFITFKFNFVLVLRK